MAEFERNLPYEIDGVDTEEMLAEVFDLYADRGVVQLHRSIAAGRVDEVVTILQEHPEFLDTPLLPLACGEEMKKSNGMDYEAFLQVPGVVRQTTDYPPVRQFETGDDEEPNELYPTGQCGEPETNLDTAFWTPLLRACHSGNPQMIRRLCEVGANKNFISPCNANALTVVMQNPNDLENICENLRLVATAENVLFQDYFYLAICNESLSNAEIIRCLLDIHCPLNKSSPVFADDWKSWIDPEIVSVLSPLLEN